MVGYEDLKTKREDIACATPDEISVAQVAHRCSWIASQAARLHLAKKQKSQKARKARLINGQTPLPGQPLFSMSGGVTCLQGHGRR